MEMLDNSQKKIQNLSIYKLLLPNRLNLKKATDVKLKAGDIS